MSVTADRLRQLRRDAGLRPSAPAALLPAPSGPVAPTIASLRRLLGLRDRPVRSPLAITSDREVPGTEIAPGLRLIESHCALAYPESLSLAFARRDGQLDTSSVLFFDTETTGLAGGTGTRAFMIGAARLREGRLEVRQLLMTTLAAESAMLALFRDWLSPPMVLASYNGRAYDASLLKTRYRLSRQIEPLTGLDHVDLLYPTRRAYRGQFENCRLATIERRVLNVVREDDLPGSQAPAAWLQYVRGGSASGLRRVVEHNRQDVVTLALLMHHLATCVASEPR